MKKVHLTILSCGSIILLISFAAILSSNAIPDAPGNSYCYVDCSESGSNDFVRIQWKGKLDDGWYYYTNWDYEDDYGPYPLDADGVTACLLSYDFVHLACRVIIYGDDIEQTQCVPYAGYTGFYGDSTRTNIVSAYMYFDNDFPFPCAK